MAEEVLGGDDVEVARRLDQLHRRVVDVHELELHLWVLRRHLGRYAPPEPAG